MLPIASSRWLGITSLVAGIQLSQLHCYSATHPRHHPAVDPILLIPSSASSGPAPCSSTYVPLGDCARLSMDSQEE